MKLRTLLLMPAMILAATCAHAKDHVVNQKDRAFQPTALTVNVGDKILFKNSDTVAHNVFSPTAGRAFDLRIQRPGELAPIQMLKAGIVEVRCAIHPGMRLQVTVKN